MCHPTGSNAERTRAHNRQVVLGQVRGAGQAGRAAIARATGLSTQTVSNIIAELLEGGFLAEAGRRVAGRGQPAVQYVLAPGGGHALGVEVQPDGIFAALVDLGGRERFAAAVALDAPTPEAVAEGVSALLERSLAATGLPRGRVLGAGVVLPGPFGQTGLSGADLAYLPGWSGIEPRHWFTTALGLPVLIDNDANAAALAERVSGGAADLRVYGYLYFGSGLGLGVVSGGQVLRGAHGNAGEIGQMPVWHSGARRPLEAAVSMAALRRHLAAAGRRGGDPARLPDARGLACLLEAGDPALLSWLDAACAPLAEAVGLVENLFDPQAVYLGGALPDALIDRLIAGLALPDASVARRPDRVRPRVLRGSSGRFTAARGAAALVINDTFTPRLALPV